MSYLGYAVIGGSRFEITSLHMSGGEFRVDIELPPSTKTSRGRIAVYGRDGKLVATGKMVIVPPHDFTALFTYGLTIDQVTSAGKTVNLGALPGWK